MEVQKRGSRNKREEGIDMLVDEIEEFVKKRMAGLPPSHDFLHVQRVKEIALNIGRNLGADLEVLELASLLHDVGLKDELEDKGNHAQISAEIARDLLSGRISDEKLEKIVDAIENHRYSSGKTPKYLEGKILQMPID